MLAAMKQAKKAKRLTAYMAPMRFSTASGSCVLGWPPPPMQPPGQAMTCVDAHIAAGAAFGCKRRWRLAVCTQNTQRRQPKQFRFSLHLRLTSTKS